MQLALRPHINPEVLNIIIVEWFSSIKKIQWNPYDLFNLYFY